MLREISRSRVQLSPGAFYSKMDIKKYYEELKKKAKLPDFETVDSEFQIGEIDKGNYGLQISEKIAEKTDRFRKFLEEYLHADGSSVAVLMEIKGMNEKDKESINLMYKEIVLIERNLALAELDNRDESYGAFIEESLRKWQEVKPGLKELILKAKESWMDTSKVKEELSYMM